MCIRDGDPLQITLITLTRETMFCLGMVELAKRLGIEIGQYISKASPRRVSRRGCFRFAFIRTIRPALYSVRIAIENKRGKAFGDYQNEFEYLISAGIALDVQAISTPVFPLIESTGKNLLKLYLNDVGILTGILYGNNIRAVLDDEMSINCCSDTYALHTHPQSAKLLPVFLPSPCTYYATFRSPCLVISGLFICSGDIN